MLRIFYVLLFQLRILMHDTFLNVHSQDMCITKNDLIDVVLTVNDVSTNGANELVLHNVRYVPGIKKSLLSVGQMDMHGYSILFERGSWKMTKG